MSDLSRPAFGGNARVRRERLPMAIRKTVEGCMGGPEERDWGPA